MPLVKQFAAGATARLLWFIPQSMEMELLDMLNSRLLPRQHRARHSVRSGFSGKAEGQL